MTLLGTDVGHGPAARPTAGWRRVATSRAASVTPVALILLSLPMVRPNILGETGLSLAGCGLLCVAAVLALITRSASAAPAGSPPGASGGMSPSTPLVVCLGLGYLWLIVQAAANDPARLGGPAVQGLILTAGSVLALTVVCADPRVRLAVGRAFVIVIVTLCVSFVVTALIWAVAGVGSGSVAAIPVGTTHEPQPIYFPFTTTLGTQAVLGVEFPRFTGLGREPGWMAMYCAVAYFMTDVVGLRSRWLKAALLAGLVGCISTAGFGVFVVAWAYHLFLRDRGTGISVGGFLRQILGLAATAGAVWLAVTAPVLGLAAKTTLNATSLDERQLATEAGLRALFTSPLGGSPTEVQGGINLISDIAVSGLPFVLLICAALLLPVVAHRGPVRFSNAVVVIVFLTFLTSQPAKDSTWAFAVVALAVSLRMPDMEPLVPTDDRPADHRRTDHRRTDHHRTTGGRT